VTTANVSTVAVAQTTIVQPTHSNLCVIQQQTPAKKDHVRAIPIAPPIPTSPSVRLVIVSWTMGQKPIKLAEQPKLASSLCSVLKMMEKNSAEPLVILLVLPHSARKTKSVSSNPAAAKVVCAYLQVQAPNKEKIVVVARHANDT
tara:strand:- start:7141 stop:7575 length:435 start_codon:yes stop_codon:yes gene_type:complete